MLIFKLFHQVCVWPQADRSPAISLKHIQKMIESLFTKFVCGASRGKAFRKTKANIASFTFCWFSLLLLSRIGRIPPACEIIVCSQLYLGEKGESAAEAAEAAEATI